MFCFSCAKKDLVIDNVMGYLVCEYCGVIQDQCDILVPNYLSKRGTVKKHCMYSRMKNFDKKLNELTGRLYIPSKIMQKITKGLIASQKITKGLIASQKITKGLIASQKITRKEYTMEELKLCMKKEKIHNKYLYSLFKVLNGRPFFTLTFNQMDQILHDFWNFLIKFQKAKNPRKNMFYYKFLLLIFLDKRGLPYPPCMFKNKTVSTNTMNKELYDKIMH